MRKHSAMVKLVVAMAALEQLKRDNAKFIFIMDAEIQIRHYAKQVRNNAIMYSTRGDNWNGALGSKMPMNNPTRFANDGLNKLEAALTAIKDNISKQY
jgi:hypothetical protein